MNTNKIYDVCIIGGGINGTAIAADAAGRGLTTVLCEQNDLASGTSSKSSKLIHGGLRYLEQYEFDLVRKALAEREILLRRAPHLIQPLELVLPVQAKLRSPFLIRIGLFLYDHLSKRKIIPKSKKIKLRHDGRGKPLQNNYEIGFSYYDCVCDDARLVIANALAAKEHGAEILPHREVTQVTRGSDYWSITIVNKLTGAEKTIAAKALINASGPWLDQLNNKFNLTQTAHSELVQGSHIVVAKFYCGDQAYILQAEDKRIIFVIPYLEDYLLIGTTDVAFNSDLQNVAIHEDEITYLCENMNQYFNKVISAKDVIWSYAGVRSLVADEHQALAEVTRDFKIECHDAANKMPYLTVYGGKITTHRVLAEAVLAKLQTYFPDLAKPWTANSPLPGGDIEQGNISQFLNYVIHKYDWLPKQLALRYVKNYGSLVDKLLENCHSLADLGVDFGNQLYQVEVEYLIINEWACSAEDILWRRTKLGLRANLEMQEGLTSFLDSVFKNN